MTLPEIIIKLRDKIELTPPEEQRYCVLSEGDLEILINMVNSYNSIVEQVKKEHLDIHRKYQTAAELVAKISGDKRSLMRERDVARQSFCYAAAKLRGCTPKTVARCERWHYLFKKGT
jgi:hypothetical protein